MGRVLCSRKGTSLAPCSVSVPRYRLTQQCSTFQSYPCWIRPNLAHHAGPRYPACQAPRRPGNLAVLDQQLMLLLPRHKQTSGLRRTWRARGEHTWSDRHGDKSPVAALQRHLHDCMQAEGWQCCTAFRTQLHKQAPSHD